MNAVKPSVAREFLVDTIKAGLVPMLKGSPGIGKSSIVASIANEYGLKLIDERLSQCDPTDLKGFPVVKDGRMAFQPPNIFPLVGDDLPKDKKGWLLFLDEMNSAPDAIQAAAYKLVLDRQVGEFNLHPMVVIVCAGNLEDDGAITNELSTAMQSRLVHINMTSDSKEWSEHATKHDFDYRVVAYINYRPSCLNNFNPDHSDQTFACERTWEFASKLMANWDDVTPAKLPLLKGTLGEGVATEFMQFLRVFEELPDIRDIERNPKTAKVPNEPGTRYAMSAVIADNTTKTNADALLDYVDRLPKEFQIITIRDMTRRCPEIESNQKLLDKATELAAYL